MGLHLIGKIFFPHFQYYRPQLQKTLKSFIQILESAPEVLLGRRFQLLGHTTLDVANVAEMLHF